MTLITIVMYLYKKYPLEITNQFENNLNRKFV